MPTMENCILALSFITHISQQCKNHKAFYHILIKCYSSRTTTLHHTTTVLQPFFRDHPGEPVPEENFWTLWCKGRLTEADTSTIRLGATPSGLTSAHLLHPLSFRPPPDMKENLYGYVARLLQASTFLPTSLHFQQNSHCSLYASSLILVA